MLLFFCGLNAVAQQIHVKGVVISKGDNEPVIGASVLEAGTTNGTITDLDGNFEMDAKKGADLVVSYIGYKNVTVKAEANLQITMEEDAAMLDEVVVTGYMTEKKADLTGSVAVVKMKDVADVPTGNVLSSLQGRVAGMNITTDGTPGGGGTKSLVRGTTTFNNASPLYVIDGMMTRDNVGTILSSGDVESIQVLKDAASAAIYGAQAANGVIIITTKRAKQGQIKVDFDMSLTAQTFSTGFNLLNTQQWGDVYWQAYKYSYNTTPNSTVYGNGPTAVPQQYYYDQDGIKIRVGDTDWQKEMYSTALMQTYNLTLSKGTENSNSSLSVNYIDQDGMMKNSDYKSFNTRLMNEFRFLNDRLKIGENATITRWTEHKTQGGLEEQLLKQMPQVPVYDENGGYAGGYTDILNDSPNPVRLQNNQANNKHEYWRIFGNAYLELQPIKNLILKSTFGVNYLTENHKEFTPKWREASRNVTVNELSQSHATQFDWVWTNTANYSLSLGEHNLSVLAAYEAKKNHYEYMRGYGRDLALENPDYQYLDVVTNGKNVNSTANTYAMVSIFGKINYTYSDKYLASVTVRRDASSRFGSQKNSGVFPSVSAGWRISREKFMSRTEGWLNELKIRGSWGINGNDQIDNSATYNLYVASLDHASYNMIGDGTTLATGAYRTHLGNPGLRWEQTEQVNVGVDASFLDSRLNVSLDYFNKNTKDMLYQPAYAGVIGEGGYSFQNCAKMNNRGFELTAGWRDSKRDFSYEISGNLSIYSNKITDVPESIYYTFGCGDGVSITNVGLPYGSWLGFKTDGLFRNQAEVDEYNSKYQVELGRAGVGRIRYVDTNNDGKINSNDRVYLGSDQPKVIAGLNLSFSYKNWDLSMFFNGMVRDAWNNSKYYTDLFQCWMGNHSTRLLDALDAWKGFEATGNYDSNIPALTADNSNNEDRASDFYIENGSYIKLKTLTLGYTIPTSVLSKIKVRQARVFLQTQNLFTITSYKGADPEGLGYTYPLPRTFTFGLSVGL